MLKFFGLLILGIIIGFAFLALQEHLTYKQKCNDFPEEK
jgi:hypothetical protein